MGARGPVPKRSAERRRRNKDSQPETVDAEGTVAIPAPDEDWHAIARDWYDSLAESGQSRYFEPSDWAAARFVAEAMSRNLDQGQRFSSVLFAAAWSAMGDLLTTEASRRRVRLEVERGESDEAPAGVTALAEYRKALGN